MIALTLPDYNRNIAQHLQLSLSQVQAAIRLLEEGNTIPFIARYRKEMTGELDENQLRSISATYDLQKNLFERKQDVLRLLEEQGVFQDEALKDQLWQGIQTAKTMTEIDDLYRPYRPKRKTRASVAKERGLAPLATWLSEHQHMTKSLVELESKAQSFVSTEKDVPTWEDALQGAKDILAEQVADAPEHRQWARETTFRKGLISSTATDGGVESVYEAYYEYAEALSKVLPHRILAMNRGEREGFLKLTVDAPSDEIVQFLFAKQVPSTIRKSANLPVVQVWEETALDSYKRLLAPAIEREIRGELTANAETQAIKIFGENLKNLLLQPPVRGKRVLGVDPAYRTGCKLAVVDETGKMLLTTVIYPTPPQSKVESATAEVLRIFRTFQIELVTIGNGTASRETESFIADCVRLYREQSQQTVQYAIVSEAGASVYSASPLAGEEFPDLDVSERSAISIARRMQDPLAELVKIDPKAVGVGQYQHDVSEKRLDEQLAAVVESAVNQVGVDVNTASPSLLAYVAGLNKTVAKNIVEFRENNGRFSTRKMLGKVPRLGPKTLEQCVGFLRVIDGDEPLDATPIHPESYSVARHLLKRAGDVHRFLNSADYRKSALSQLKEQSIEHLASELGTGIPTLVDILDALERPGRDPREDIAPPVLRTDVLKIEDLAVGMILTGTVRNVVDFGAFVDIGIKNDGLVHISQLADKFVKHPMDVVAVGDVVQVCVIQVDANKGRVGLSMRLNA